MSNNRLMRLAASLRALMRDSQGLRPLLCDGDPYACRVAIVGANPGTTTPFWPFWSDGTGVDKAAWLAAYRDQHNGRYGRSRAAIERLLPRIDARVIELNAYAHQSTRLADLSIEKKTNEVLRFVFTEVRPEVALCAGADAARAVTGLHVDWPMVIIEAKHFIYWGLQREAELAREINAALYRRTVSLPSRPRQTDAREHDDRGVALTKPASRALQQRACPKMVDRIETLRHRATDIRFSTVGGRGGQFTVTVRDAGRGLGIEFIRADGSSKSVSAERFMKFWRLWTAGVRDLDEYRNETGQQTRAASAVYCLPVFEWLSHQPG